MRKTMSKPRLASIAVIATVGVVLAGCSAEDGGSEPGEKPDTLRMLYTTAEANATAVQSRVDAFEQEFGIELDIDTQPYDALQQRVFSEIASSSDYYDIYVVDTPWAPAIVGNLEPLSTYLTNDEMNEHADADVADFIPKYQ